MICRLDRMVNLWGLLVMDFDGCFAWIWIGDP
jgi:hypothetical protein